MQDPGTRALFSEYIDIVNRAIAQNRDRVPYKQLVAGSERLLRDRPIDVLIHDEERAGPRVRIALEDGQLVLRDQQASAAETDTGEAAGDEAADALKWNVSRAHIERVVADPFPFIESPLRLEIDWLLARLAR